MLEQCSKTRCLLVTSSPSTLKASLSVDRLQTGEVAAIHFHFQVFPRHEDEPPQAERFIPRATAPLHFPAAGNPLIKETFSAEGGVYHTTPHRKSHLGNQLTRASGLNVQSHASGTQCSPRGFPSSLQDRGSSERFVQDGELAVVSWTLL